MEKNHRRASRQLFWLYAEFVAISVMCDACNISFPHPFSLQQYNQPQLFTNFCSESLLLPYLREWPGFYIVCVIVYFIRTMEV